MTPLRGEAIPPSIYWTCANVRALSIPAIYLLVALVIARQSRCWSSIARVGTRGRADGAVDRQRDLAVDGHGLLSEFFDPAAGNTRSPL